MINNTNLSTKAKIVLEFIARFVKENGRYPNKEEVRIGSGVGQPTLAEVYKELTQNGFFEITPKNTYLATTKMKNFISTYTPPSSNTNKEEKTIPENTPKPSSTPQSTSSSSISFSPFPHQTPQTTTRKKERENSNFFENLTKIIEALYNEIKNILTVKLIRLMLALFATAMVGFSVLYTYRWFAEREAPILALIFSATIVPLISYSYVFMRQKAKHGHKAKAFVWGFIWITSTTFSMLTTITSYYNRQVEFENKQVEIAEESDKISMQLEIIENQINNKKEELELYKKQEKQITNTTGWRYQDITTKIRKITTEINDLENKKLEIIEKNKNITFLSKKKKKNFYTFLYEIFKINPSTIEFLLYLFPAIFIDIVTPLLWEEVIYGFKSLAKDLENTNSNGEH